MMKNFWLAIDGMKNTQSNHCFVLVMDCLIPIFKYQNLEVTVNDGFSVSCKFEVQNVGDISGSEIAQCYVSFAEAQQDEPCKTLQGFVKEEIGANQIQKIEIILKARNFSYWSVETNTWQIRKGSYGIHIGSSSENIFLEANINLEQALEVL